MSWKSERGLSGRAAILGLAIFCMAFGQAGAQERVFPVDVLKQDLQFYQAQLERRHPNLYLYTTKQSIGLFFDSLNTLIDRPMTELEFYRILALSSSVVNDGHTLILPSAATTEFHNTNSLFLPFQITISDNALYVRLVCTADRSIPEGAQIIRINGIPASEALGQMVKRQVRDGLNTAYAYWALGQYFREYYSYTFGHPDAFDIEYLQGDDAVQARAGALPKDSIYYYRALYYPGVSFENEPLTGLTLRFEGSGNDIAILTVKDFHNEVLRREYKQHFKKAISGYFNTIMNSGAENLIIDLRDNQGGDVKNGVFLLSYLLDRPFKVISECHCIRHEKYSSCKGPSAGVHRPRRKTFRGDLYVLINGGSFSNSVIVASCLKENGRAVFIGQQSGGNPNVLAGYADDFELPHTKIRVEVPSKRLILTSLARNTGAGLEPTYEAHSSIADILNGTDAVLDFAIGLIKQKGGNGK